MRRFTRRRLVIVMSVLFGALVFVARTVKLHTRPAMVPTRGTVRRVVDGDTFHLTNGLVVRLLEVDAPELTGANAPPAREASRQLRRMIAGKRVRMEAGGRPTDKYGRYLAYVFAAAGETGTAKAGGAEATEPAEVFVNAELARLGLVRAKTWDGAGVRFEEIRAAEGEAREARRGIWAAKE